MSEIHQPVEGGSRLDTGEYCRKVEEHLTRVNEGHLVRVVGPAFELVRGWALAGVPISVVFRGIDNKAERHRAGRSKRPLRLEFCETDVRAVLDDWRRAVGLPPDAGAVDGVVPSPAVEERRRPSLVRQLDRAIERLVRATSQLDASERFRTETSLILDALVQLREESRHARGTARQRLGDRIGEIDRQLANVARVAVGDALPGIEAEASAELAPFRARLSAQAWERSLTAGVDRILRERLGLPTLDVDSLSA